MTHTTPHIHVFAPTTYELTVRYRCLLCECSGYRHLKGMIVAHKTPQPQEDEWISSTFKRKPTLDQYDCNFE